MDAAAVGYGGGGLLDDHALTHLPPPQVEVQVRRLLHGRKSGLERRREEGRRKTHKNRTEQGVMDSMATMSAAENMDLDEG